MVIEPTLSIVTLPVNVIPLMALTVPMVKSRLLVIESEPMPLVVIVLNALLVLDTV